VRKRSTNHSARPAIRRFINRDDSGANNNDKDDRRSPGLGETRGHIGGSIFLRPVAHIIYSVILNAASQVFLRVGASDSGNDAWSALRSLGSVWVWCGIVAQVTSLFSWLHALRTIKLLVAFNLSGLLHVLVPFAGWLVLGEHIPAWRWFGISLVLAGVLVVGAPAAKVGERL